MSAPGRWLVELSIAERGGQTRADGRLIMADGACWVGHGGARRHPRDPDIAQIGEKIAREPALPPRVGNHAASCPGFAGRL